MTVQAWSQSIIIPTYPIGKPEKNPVFLEKRVYQGSSGVVYPYPVIESVADEKEDRQWLAIFLENRYLKIMILPELGGRVQMALDKTNGYHFIYYNRVIKPALVGLAGPWISGGIEFNWPQHHRPNTFGPVSWRIEAGEDGSQTVWCAEYEIMFNTKGMHGFRLYPDRAYLEIDVQLYNRTSEPQTFLWWANPAVHVNDDYQSIFPPDVHAVMDHGKRDVSTFPIATGTYYKVNYAPGTDISRYKNIPVPTSYMAYYSDYDFVGCYDHGKQAGMMHIANHHTVPGKKQWTWGTSNFGQAWDRQLTDEDGPYIELMCGAYTDNQPDFSWLMPGEEKRFTQVFMPYKGIGGAKNANKEVVANLVIDDNHATIGVYVTSPRQVTVKLLYTGDIVFERSVDLTPETSFVETTVVTYTHALLRRMGHDGRGILYEQDLVLQVFEAQSGEKLLEFSPPAGQSSKIPDAAKPARAPQEIASNEELFLNGLHLEQYRHANFAPEPYYEEALRRDPFDSHCNNALGLLMYRRGKFAEAEPYFRKAIESLTRRNPNPYDGEPYYNLGLALKMQGRFEKAFDAFYKAVWNAAWQDAAYFELAKLACRAGKLEESLDLSTRSLQRNWTHHKARHLKIALLRRLGREEAARKEIAIALDLDRMEFGALWEQRLLTNRDEFAAMAAQTSHICSEIALDYANAGLWDEAIQLLKEATQDGGTTPLTFYYLAWVYEQAGQHAAAQEALLQAAQLSPALCFPNRLEDVLVLQNAIRLAPQDAHVPFLLGNFWYAHRRYSEAAACWEQSRTLDTNNPTVHRNLGLVYWNKQNEAEKALRSYETAFQIDPTDARVFFELDQLYKKLNRSPQERLINLEAHADLVTQRDDLTIERISLLNLLARHDEAFDLLMARNFHPWEGGEGKATGQYVTCLVEKAKSHLSRNQPEAAIDCLERAQLYPHNLGEGKLYGAQENQIFYWLGCAYEKRTDSSNLQPLISNLFEKAAVGLSEPTSAIFYNDQPPDMIFYQGLARQKLGRGDEAKAIFHKLIDYGQNHFQDEVTMDYFAVSLPDFLVFDEDLSLRNRIHCHYMMALGYLGLREMRHAQEHFDAVLALRADHLGATIHSKAKAP
ncbi:MAG: DUF5107 domain-containing protein [Caldilineaceae bacterium]